MKLSLCQNLLPRQAQESKLVVTGRPANIKLEKYLDKIFQKIAAATFIQKVYRGYCVRKRLSLFRMHKGKKEKAVQLMADCLDVALERIS